MKIMLLSLPVVTADDDNMFPLGIGYLVSSLKQFHEVESYHFNNMKKAENEIPLKCLSFKPNVVGLTCSSFNRGSVRKMIKLVKSIDKNIVIILGGVHASYCYDQMLNIYDADYVVIGEGETTLHELCDAIENNKSITSIKGIAYKREDSILLNPAGSSIDNLDELPIPDFEYARHNIEQNKMGFIITSRGCPVRCSFCSTSSYWGQKIRKISVQRIADEIEALISKFNIKKLFFHDDTFNLGISRVMNICSEIKRRGFKIEWGCNCRVKPISEEMIACMVDAGCRHICWGIESGSQEMLENIHKKISLSDICHAFELSEKYSNIMSTGAFTMVGNPGESEKTIQETVSFLNTLRITDAPSTSILYVLPGTLQYETFRKKGFIRDDDWIKYDSVPYYTVEHSFRTLSRWAKMVRQSGSRIPFDPQKHFWYKIPDTSHQKPFINRNVLFRNAKKLIYHPELVVKKIKSYLPAGHIRF